MKKIEEMERYLCQVELLVGLKDINKIKKLDVSSVRREMRIGCLFVE